MKVSIIIVSYNSSKRIKKCLDAVFNMDYPKKGYEVIIVDNNSNDNSIKIIKKYKNIKLIENKENSGFSGGNNIGLKIARGEYIALINDDIIVDKKWLGMLVPIMDSDKKIGGCGGIIYYGNGEKKRENEPWFSGAKIYFGGFVNHKFLGEKEGECDYIACSAALIRKKVIDEIGFFDERFWMYSEDIDLFKRMKRRRYKAYYFPKAKSWHMIDKNRVSSSQEYYEQRNRVYLCTKDYGFIGKIGFLILDFFVLFPFFWAIRVIRNPKKLNFLKETIRARIDSIIMILQ